MKTQKLTVRQIRTILFGCDKYAVIGQDELTNKDARDHLYNINDQESILNIIQAQTHLLIWK